MIFHAPESCHTEDIRAQQLMLGYIILGVIYVTYVIQPLSWAKQQEEGWAEIIGWTRQEQNKGRKDRLS